MTPGLFDTNILVDCVKGIQAARTEIESYPDRAISIITWMEVMVWATPANEAFFLEFLEKFVILPLTRAIAEQAVLNRRGSRLKLPDAIILATAQIEGRLLISRNTKDFPASMNGVRVPYTL